MRLGGTHPDPVVGAAVFGVAILGAAFLLSWAAETAEMDVSHDPSERVTIILGGDSDHAVASLSM